MKQVEVIVDIFEKGDRVLTAEGEGTVMSNEEIPMEGKKVRRDDLAYSEVFIELDESCSGWSGKKGAMEATNLMLISPEKPKQEPETAVELVDKIIRDLTGRKGLRQEWEMIDKDIQEEIRDEWISIMKGGTGK